MFKSILGLFLAILIAPTAWAQSSYTIQSGDVLQLEVLEDPSLNRSLLVLPDGSVSLPLAGSVSANGQTVDSLRSAISAALAPNFAAPPTVFLSVGQLNPATVAAASSVASNLISVYALGEFNTQGRVDIEPGTTLLQFIAESGGLTKFASLKRLQLRRADTASGTEKVYKFNLKAVQAGASAPLIVLRAGDVIVAPERRLFE